MTELHDHLDYDNDNDNEHRLAEHERLLMQYLPTENPEELLPKGDFKDPTVIAVSMKFPVRSDLSERSGDPAVLGRGHPCGQRPR